MAPGFNIYNMNMNGNPWMQLASQGLGMFGGNSMGFGMGGFGSLTGMGCGSIFTNCYGEPNYNAMAGYGVANALLGVAGQAWAAHQANKEPEVNYTQEIKKLRDEVKTKTDKKAELADEIRSENNKKTAASETKGKLDTDLATAQTSLTKLEQELNDATNLTDDQRNTLKLKIENAKNKIEELEAKIKAQQDIIDAADEKIKANERDCAKLQDEIDELNKKLEAYQSKVNENILDQADRGKLQRAGKGCLKETYNEQNPASERQLSRAFYEYNKATNDTDKKYYAKKIIEMYKSNNQLENANSSNKQGYQIVQKWLETH